MQQRKHPVLLLAFPLGLLGLCLVRGRFGFLLKTRRGKVFLTFDLRKGDQ